MCNAGFYAACLWFKCIILYEFKSFLEKCANENIPNEYNS